MKYHWSLSVAVAGLFALLLQPLDATAAQRVESFTGKATGYVIKRGGKELFPKPLMGLKAGDVITVKTSSGRIGILRSDKSVHTVTKGNSPYKVTAEQKVSAWDNLMNITVDWFGSSEGDTAPTEMIARSSSPTTIQVVSAPAEENLLMQGQDEFDMAWIGGTAPYTAAVYPKNVKTPVWQGKNLSGTRDKVKSAKLKIGSLTPAAYQIKITSQAPGNKAATMVDVRVVPMGQLPKKVREIMKSGFPDSVKRRLLITVLAQKPEWRFQAYAMACRHGVEDARLAMESGHYPKR